MGVSLDAWRAAIGLFGHKQFHSRCSCSRSGSGKWTSTVMPVLAVIMVLLLIGNIEKNPGPACKFKSCGFVTETIASCVRHQFYHSSSSNFMFYCPSPECVYSSKSFNALNYHVSMFHRETKHHNLEDPEADKKLSCTVPGCHETMDSLWSLVQHICQHLDSCSPLNGVRCPVEDCDHPSLFCKSSTFRVHLSQYHRGWRDEGAPSTKRRRVDDESSTTGSSHFTESVDLGVDQGGFGEDIRDEADDGETEDCELLNEDLIVELIAKFYLQLYGEFFLPYDTIQEICNGISFICGLNNLRIKKILKAGLKPLGVGQLQVNELCYKVSSADILFATHHKNAPGPSLTSDYLRKEYFKKNYDFQEPDEISLSRHLDSDQKIQYVAIKNTLSTIFKDPVVQKDIDESFLKCASNSNEVSDYTGGSLFKKENHEKKELHLFLYIDAYNPVMNALGSAKDKYKSLVMYFTLGNLKHENRSKIDSKHLVVMVRESVFKEVGAKICFEEPLKELKSLEEVGTTYKDENIKVKVMFMLGDNLGQHTIGGYIECFTSTYFCRFCDIEQDVFHENPEQTNPPRSKEEYENCVREAKLTDEICKGIKDDCVFNDLQNFHAVSHLCPCIAHDLFEGVVSWDLAGIIRSFVRKKWFSYKLLNKRIDKFKCNGIDASNKPANVRYKGKSKYKKLGGHAVQNWALLRLLPFIIGDKIQDFNDPAYKLYLQLKELCEYFCSHTFLKSDVPYIKDVLVPLYFQRRSEVLDESEYPLKPKYHFSFGHYCELMLRYGPLIQVWTLGFEQKHKLFKHVCRVSKNFINVEYTCAMRHQLNLAFKATGHLFPEGCIETDAEVFSIDSYQGELKKFLGSMSVTQKSCRTCKSIDVDGISYTVGSLLLLKSNGIDIDCGRIRVIVCTDNEVQFVLDCIKATFNSTVGTYEIPEDTLCELTWVPARGLKYAQPQPLYDFKGKLSFNVKGKVI